jgi:hypothetical protein
MAGLSGRYLSGITTVADRVVLFINLAEIINPLSAPATVAGE